MQRIYTIGYSGKKPADIDALVRSLNAALFDIRFSPRSMYPAWSGKQFRERLGKSYFHVPEFGNENYHEKGGKFVVSDYIAGTQRVEQCEFSTIILMCACRDLRRCHRQLVATHLRIKGYHVDEIANIEQHLAQPRLFDVVATMVAGT